MTRSVFLSSLVGGVIAFVWGFISWVIIPWHAATLKHFNDSEAVCAALSQNASEDGVYIYHPMENQYSQDDNMPFVFASINRMHASQKQTMPMIRSFITLVVAAFLISWVLVHAKSRRYWDLVTYSAVIGLIIGILAYVPLWNWWGIAGSFTMVGVIDTVITWFLAGLGMAKFIERVKVPK